MRPTEYVEIPNIQPDLQTADLIAKRANLDRVKEFSKNLKNFNTENLRFQSKLPAAGEKNDMTLALKKMDSSRQKAIEYGRSVPKPTKLMQGGVYAHAQQRAAPRGEQTNVGLEQDEDYMEIARREELEAKHLANKAQIEAMKRQMGLN